MQENIIIKVVTYVVKLNKAFCGLEGVVQSLINCLIKAKKFQK